jgi:YidC/Oxa1 family membrane protein insertase
VDKNVVTATILIAIIMVVWLTWMSPTPPATLPSQDDSTQVEQQEVPVIPEPREELPPVGVAPIAISDSTAEFGNQAGDVRDIVVRTRRYVARFSTLGGTLTSLQLNDFTKFDSETAVQIVDTTKGGALAIVFTSPANRVYDTRTFVYQANIEGDELEVLDSPSELVFTTDVGKGRITQRYEFSPDSYEIGLSIEQKNVSVFETGNGYELTWNGGIPFTEGDHKNESTRSGAFARSGGEVEEVLLSSESYGERSLRGKVDWVVVKNKYFLTAVIPDTPSRGAALIGERVGELVDPDLQLNFVASLSMPLPTGVDHFRIYAGPLELSRLAEYDLGLYDTVDYGWDFFETVTRPLAKYVFIPAFTLLSSFIPNYGLVIIILSFLIKLVLFPLTKSSFKNMARMKELQPRMEAIKEKYSGDPQKQQQATMKMYKETGVNPLGGCLPMLLQYPIIIALWQFLPQAIEIRQQGFLWASDLSAPDIILNLPFDIPMFGSAVAGFTMLMGLSMVVQMKMQATPGTGAQQKIFTYLFPIMIFVIFNKLASGLNLYYLCYNVLTAAQQKLINKQMEHKHKLEEAQNGSSVPRKKSSSNGQSGKRKGKKKSR